MTGPNFRLVPTSTRSQAFTGGVGGGGDLELSPAQPTRIGRAPDNTVKLPADWIQISSRHCCITYVPEKDVWKVQDFSTNGTFINGQRIGKGEEAEAKTGDRIQLSVVDPKAPDAHMEYVLRRSEGSPEAATSAVQPSITAAAPAGVGSGAVTLVTPKRKPGSAPGDSIAAGPATKRSKATPGTVGAPSSGTRAPPQSPAVVVGTVAGRKEPAANDGGAGGGDIQALFKLQENNQKLVRELDAARIRQEHLEQRLKDETANARRHEAEARAKAQDEIKELQAEVRQAGTELIALRQAELSLKMDLEAANKAAVAAAQEAAQAAQAVEFERAHREAAEARVARVEAELTAARYAQQAAEAASAEARTEKEEVQGARLAVERHAAELFKNLEAAKSAEQQTREQAESLHDQLAEERRAREAVEGQLAEVQAAADEARHYIASLESRERLLQNDRLLVDGCLSVLQLGNQRSQAANKRINDAFAQLLQAKAEADAIMEHQCQQCSDICAKLAASNGSRLLAPSPAQAQPGMLAGTQELMGPGAMLSPAGAVPMTAPAAPLGTPVMAVPAAEREQCVAATMVALQQVAREPVAGNVPQQGHATGDWQMAELEAIAEGTADVAAQQAKEEEWEVLGQQDDEMADVQDEGDAAGAVVAAAAAEAAAAVGTAPAAEAEVGVPVRQAPGSGSKAASAPVPTRGGAVSPEVVVVDDSEEEEQEMEAARTDAAATARVMVAAEPMLGEVKEGEERVEEVAADSEAVDAAVGQAMSGANGAQSTGGDNLGGSRGCGNADVEDEGPAAEPPAAAAATEAPAPVRPDEGGPYSASTRHAASGPLKAGQGAAYGAEPEQQASEEYEGVAHVTDEDAGNVVGAPADGEAEGEEEYGDEVEATPAAADAVDGGGKAQEEVCGLERAAAARAKENEASQGNTAGTQDDGTTRSLPSKVPDREQQQQQDSRPAAVPDWM